MNSDIPRSRARSAGHAILRIIVAFPIACFSGALATDITYAATANMMWADFSAWLLAVGIIMGGLAALGGLAYLLSNRQANARSSAWPVVLGSLLVLVLALFDNFVHSRDAWTSVVPTGLTLSAITVVAMLITVWFGSVRLDRYESDSQLSGARR